MNVREITSITFKFISGCPMVAWWEIKSVFARGGYHGHKRFPTRENNHDHEFFVGIAKLCKKLLMKFGNQHLLVLGGRFLSTACCKASPDNPVPAPECAPPISRSFEWLAVRIIFGNKPGHRMLWDRGCMNDLEHQQQDEDPG